MAPTINTIATVIFISLAIDNNNYDDDDDKM